MKEWPDTLKVGRLELGAVDSVAAAGKSTEDEGDTIIEESHRGGAGRVRAMSVCMSRMNAAALLGLWLWLWLWLLCCRKGDANNASSLGWLQASRTPEK